MRTDRLRALIAAAAALACTAAAAQSSPWYLSGLVSFSHDDNLLRLGEGQQAPADQSRSDSVRSTALIGGIDQGIGRQRLQGSLTLRDNRFDRNSRYDNQSYSGNLSLSWSTVGRLAGELSASRARALSTFNADGIGLLTQRNDETTETYAASLSAGLVTAFSLELGASQRRVRNELDLPAVQARNLDQDSAFLGVAWRPGSALETTLSMREARGRFPNFGLSNGQWVDDPFTQRGVDLSTRWRPTGTSQTELRLGSGRTRYGRGGDRDFDSFGGSLAWGWQPTGKLGVNLRLSRDKGQDSFPAVFIIFPVVQSDLRTTDTLRLQLDWAATAKLAATFSAQQAQRDVTSRTRTTNGNLLVREVQGRDDSTSFSLGLRWAPQRWALLGCDLRDERRDADGAVTTDLKNASISCYAQATLR